MGKTYARDVREERKADRTATPGWNMSQAPIIGHWFRDPQQGAAINAMKQASVDMNAYRPLQAQGYQNAMNNQMSLYTPYNNAMASSYGPQAKQDLSPNDFSPVVTEEMLTSSTPEGPGPSPGGTTRVFGRGIARRKARRSDRRERRKERRAARKAD